MTDWSNQFIDRVLVQSELGPNWILCTLLSGLPEDVLEKLDDNRRQLVQDLNPILWDSLTSLAKIDSDALSTAWMLEDVVFNQRQILLLPRPNANLMTGTGPNLRRRFLGSRRELENPLWWRQFLDVHQVVDSYMTVALMIDVSSTSLYLMIALREVLMDYVKSTVLHFKIWRAKFTSQRFGLWGGKDVGTVNAFLDSVELYLQAVGENFESLYNRVIRPEEEFVLDPFAVESFLNWIFEMQLSFLRESFLPTVYIR